MAAILKIIRLQEHLKKKNSMLQKEKIIKMWSIILNEVNPNIIEGFVIVGISPRS
jgi:hypothetical protein